MGEIQLTFIVLKYKVKVYIHITEREKGADESRLCLEWSTSSLFKLEDDSLYFVLLDIE